MSQLHGKGKSTITEHIRNIFKESELKEKVVCRKFRLVREVDTVKNLIISILNVDKE